MNFDNIHSQLPKCNSNQDPQSYLPPNSRPCFLFIGLFVYLFILIQSVLSLCASTWGSHTSVWRSYQQPSPYRKGCLFPPSRESTDNTSSDRSRDLEGPPPSILWFWILLILHRSPVGNSISDKLMCIVAMICSEKFTIIYSIPPNSPVPTLFFHNVHWASARYRC